MTLIPRRDVTGCRCPETPGRGSGVKPDILNRFGWVSSQPGGDVFGREIGKGASGGREAEVLAAEELQEAGLAGLGGAEDGPIVRRRRMGRDIEGEVGEEWWVGVAVAVGGRLVPVKGAVGDAYYGGTDSGPGWWEAHFEGGIIWGGKTWMCRTSQVTISDEVGGNV